LHVEYKVSLLIAFESNYILWL